MIQSLHKGNHITPIPNESDEGERTLLCSNRGGMRSPSLDFLDTSAEDVSEEIILTYLASIISEIYLNQSYGNKEGGDLLPGINKRAG